MGTLVPLTYKPGTLAILSHDHSCSPAPPNSELHPFSEGAYPAPCSLLPAPPSSSLVSMATLGKVIQTIRPLPLILCGFPPTQTVQVPSPAPSTTSQPCSVLRPSLDPVQAKARLPCAHHTAPWKASSLAGKRLLVSNGPVERTLLLSKTVQRQPSSGRRCT